MGAMIQLTLDGSLVEDSHKVSLRVLANSMMHLQTASDRAYLDVRYGNVWKHQRLRAADRPKADFLVGAAREGSYIIEFFSAHGKEIVKRLHQALWDPYTKAAAGGDNEIFKISIQVERRRAQLNNRLIEAQRFENFVNNPDQRVQRKYGDKSINKEIDQLLAPVRADPDAIIKLALKPDGRERTETYTFDQEIATAFKRQIGGRELGDPVLYTGQLRSLDHGHKKSYNLKGKFINAANDKDVVLHIQTKDDFDQLIPYLNQEPFTMIACPIIEYSSFDPTAGDIQFIQILK